MIPYVLYDMPTGRILARGTTLTLEDARLQIRSPNQEIALFVEADARTHYMQDSALALRPASPGFDKTIITADGMDSATIDLKITTFENVKIDGEDHIIEGKLLTISTKTPGSYKIAITAFPFLDYVATIIALEASHESRTQKEP